MDATYELLRERLASLCGVSSDNLLLAEVSGAMIKVILLFPFHGVDLHVFDCRVSRRGVTKSDRRVASLYSRTKCSMPTKSFIYCRSIGWRTRERPATRAART